MASVPVITDNWGYSLEPNIIKIWDETMDTFQDELASIGLWYDVMATDNKVATIFGIGAVGQIPTRPEGGDLPRDTREQLFKKTFTQGSRDLGVDITEEMIQFNETAEIARRVRDLATGFSRQILRDAYSTLNNAFSSSYLGPDSKELCADDHPTSPTDTTAKDNKGTTALSYDAVVATRQLMMRFTDSRGNEQNVTPDMLIVPIELEATAWTIVESMGRPTTADNDGNFIGSTGLRVLTSRYLSDTNNWFMIDSRFARLQNHWIQSDAPTIALNERASGYRKNTYAGHMMYDYGWSDWRWVYGHEVT